VHGGRRNSLMSLADRLRFRRSPGSPVSRNRLSTNRASVSPLGMSCPIEAVSK
jgi:hypothetical protein